MKRRSLLKFVSLSFLGGFFAPARSKAFGGAALGFWRKRLAFGEARTTQLIAKVLTVGGSYEARTTQLVTKVLAVGGAYEARTTQVVAKVLAVGGGYEARTTQVVVKVLVIP